MKIDQIKTPQISVSPGQIKQKPVEENKEPSDMVVLGNTGNNSGNTISSLPQNITVSTSFDNNNQTVCIDNKAGVETQASGLSFSLNYDGNITPTEQKQRVIDDSVCDDVDSKTTAKTFTFQYDTAGRKTINDIQLKGSFNPETGQYDKEWNKGKGIPMFDDGTHGDKVAGDGVYSVSVALDKTGNVKDFEWGVSGDIHDARGNKVKNDEWLIIEGSMKLNVDGSETDQIYRPTTHHLMGVHKKGENGIAFQTWSPEMGKGDLKDYKLFVDIYKDNKLVASNPMVKDEKTGNWSYENANGWKDFDGASYQYAAKDANGNPLLFGKDKSPLVYSDPYSRYLEGQQRGLERIYVDSILGIETGWYDDSGKGGVNYADNPQWGRFTVDNREKADNVQLVLTDANGKQLTKKELLDRLGEPKLKKYEEASPEEKKDADTLNRWGVDTDGKVTAYQWTDNVNEDGTINMKKIGDAWVSTVNNFDKLVGLKYEFNVYEDGKLVGDKDGDNKLNEIERKNTPFNDPVSNVISPRPGSERKSLIKESSYVFKNDLAKRKNDDPKKYVIYEAHVGSFMGSKDNANPSTFKDMIANLDYIEKLGANTIELMPVNEFGGKKDWGYTPDYYFAGAEAYGFEMPVKEAIEKGVVRADEVKDKETVWVHGTDAIKLFTDEAHKKGFDVFCDVVYNHTSGKADADNPMYLIDGDKKSFFTWWGKYISFSPWGEKPATDHQAGKEFFTNNAMQQLDEFHFDGIRFDFVQVLHDSGSTGERYEGMQTLIKINKTIDQFHPKAYTVGEDFSRSWLVPADYNKSEWQGEGEWRMEKKGMGFNAVWNDRFHDDLMGALEGTDGKFSMDRLMEAVTGHIDVANWENAVVYAHSHDEVGNSGQWASRMAAHSQDKKDVEKHYPRAMARTAAAITLTTAGTPMIFQGEEFLDNADYKHGITSTWGNDMDWLNFAMTPDKLEIFKRILQKGEGERNTEVSKLREKEQDYFERYMNMNDEQKAEAEVLANKRGNFEFYKNLIKLRDSSPAFSTGSSIERTFTHNGDRVMAYERKGGNDDYVVISNFSEQDRDNYKVGLPPGKWKEVMNSNALIYGGNNSGNGGGVVDANQGIVIPKGSTVIMKRVG
jgi:1,4-alpha-glucan branching enzyme